MSKIKVLVYGMTSNYGGVESVIMNYYRNMNRDNIQFDFISVNENIAYEDEIKKSGSKIYKVGSKAKNYFKYKKNIKKLFKNHANEYDIIWDNMCSLCNIDALIYAKKYKIKTRIIHSHNSNMNCNFIKRIFHYLNKNNVFKYANEYFACSKVAGKFMFGNHEFKIINNAIDLEKFKFDEEKRKEKRKEFNIKDDTLVIGNIGRLDRQKNHEFLIDIFDEIHKEYQNSILILIGKGNLENKIKNKVNRLGLNKSVIFLEQCFNISELYQMFDIFLLSSLYEGLPVVGVEAQASGLLCVFSSAMTKETKVLDSTLFINLNESVEKWSSIIISSLKNFNRKDSCREMSEKNFNIKIEAYKLEKEFEEKNYE